MAKTLPTRPHFEQLKKQAKELLKNYKTDDVEIFARIRENLSRLAGKSDEDIAQARFVLQDAQHVIAREYGFSTWDALATAIKTPFEAMVNLTEREVQVLLREVDQKDLVVALSGASAAVVEKFLGNMSVRVREFISDEIGYLSPEHVSKAEEVQVRMIAQVVQLSEKGLMVWPPKPAAKKKAKAPAMKKVPKKVIEEQARLAKMMQKSLSEMSYDEINKLFVDMAETARREGILALEKVGDVASDGFVKMAINLTVDGTEPALIMDMLETWKKSLMHEHEVKYWKVIEGIMSIQSGDNPRIIEHKLSVIY